MKAIVKALPTKEINIGGVLKITPNYYTKLHPSDVDNCHDRPDVYQPQHLYICSKDNIEDNDVVIHDYEDEFFIGNIKIHDDNTFTIADGKNVLNTSSDYYIEKIITSTDTTLGLPEIPEQFLNEFCEKGGIYEVMSRLFCESHEDNLCSQCPFVPNNNKICDKLQIEIKPIIKQTWTREELEKLCGGILL